MCASVCFCTCTPGSVRACVRVSIRTCQRGWAGFVDGCVRAWVVVCALALQVCVHACVLGCVVMNNI